MIRGLYTAASGMLLGLRQQDVLAQNMANSTTVGYKAEQSSQSAFGNVLARSVQSGGGGPIPMGSERVIGSHGTGVYIDKTRIHLSQGADRVTDAPLDVMVRGNGFFAVETPEGIRYTRDGHMQRDEQDRLVNADSSPVLDVNGQSITLASDHVRIKSDGSIYRLVPTDTPQPDGSVKREEVEELVAQLRLVDIVGTDLVRAGETQFAIRDGITPTQIDFADGESVIVQGVLEEGNVAVGDVATQMFSLARTFESSQRVFTTISESLQTAVRDVGRV